jgi:hypothetical protein
MSAHLYWRLLITNSAGNFASIAEWTMRDPGGSPIATTGGTASASATFGGGAPANAFDGNPSTFWVGATASTGSPQWLQYQFPSPVDVASFDILAENGGSGYWIGTPEDFSLQSSDDGITWTTAYSFLGAGWAGPSWSNTFTAGTAAPASFGIGWRLLITLAGLGTQVQISEWKLYDAAGTQISTSAYAGQCSSVALNHGPSLAFNGDGCSNYWQSSGVPSGGSPEWLEYEFASPSVSVASFSIQAPGSTTAPVNFSVQYSYDGTTWTTAGIYTAATWTGCSTQTFSPVNGPITQPQVFVVT